MALFNLSRVVSMVDSWGSRASSKAVTTTSSQSQKQTSSQSSGSSSTAKTSLSTTSSSTSTNKSSATSTTGVKVTIGSAAANLAAIAKQATTQLAYAKALGDKTAAAKASQTVSNVQAIASKNSPNQHFAPDKGFGPHYSSMVADGGGTSKKITTNTVSPYATNMSPTDIDNVKKGEGAIGNKNNGTITVTNASGKVELVADRSPHNKAVETAYNNYFSNIDEIKRAMQNPNDRLAANEAVLRAKNAWEYAKNTNDPVGMDAARKVSEYFQAHGATITSNHTLEQAKDLVYREQLARSQVKPAPQQTPQPPANNSKIFTERGQEMYSAVLSMAPFVGQIKGFTEAIHGADSVTGKPLTPFERGLSVAGVGGYGKILDVVIDTVQQAKKVEIGGKVINVRNGQLAEKTHPVSGIPYDKDGFPIFDAKVEIHLDPADYAKSRPTHISNANKALYEQTQQNPELKKQFSEEDLKRMEKGLNPKDYVWHHHQDPGRMQLVNQNIHEQTGHTGGYHIWGGNSK